MGAVSKGALVRSASKGALVVPGADASLPPRIPHPPPQAPTTHMSIGKATVAAANMMDRRSWPANQTFSHLGESGADRANGTD